ncbi:CDP-archaeol synthase, partial [Halodesulfurarchaeum sp.]|uniref:CDP-archaeol synthase n=1 Tax=Halodesulfurarchaeum sp. TaxID=1980530 RepID=UPI002FC3CE98
MNLAAIVATAIWAMLPAYVPNNAAVLGGGGRPIDGGRSWRGARLLGDGKTWRGTAVGIGAGVLLGVALGMIRDPVSVVLGIGLPVFSIGALLALPTGAMLGDIGASFLKRRTGRQRGRPFP